MKSSSTMKSCYILIYILLLIPSVYLKGSEERQNISLNERDVSFTTSVNSTSYSTACAVFETQDIYFNQFAFVNIGGLFPYSGFPFAALAAIQAQLGDNLNDIVVFFISVLGAQSETQIHSLFQSYNYFFVRFVNAVKAGNPFLIQQAITNWNEVGLNIAVFLNSQFSYAPLSTLQDLIQNRISFQQAQVYSYVNQNYVQALFDFNESREISHEIAKTLFLTQQH